MGSNIDVLLDLLSGLEVVDVDVDDDAEIGDTYDDELLSWIMVSADVECDLRCLDDIGRDMMMMLTMKCL